MIKQQNIKFAVNIKPNSKAPKSGSRTRVGGGDGNGASIECPIYACDPNLTGFGDARAPDFAPGATVQYKISPFHNFYINTLGQSARIAPTALLHEGQPLKTKYKIKKA